jgi:hypothetical protein
VAIPHTFKTHRGSLSTLDRYFINGAVGSFWILALPAKRRKQISLYVARLALMSLWKASRINGGPGLKYVSAHTVIIE